MASLEDYDEFGNYIGGDLDSDDEEDVEQETFTRTAQAREETHAPLEGFDDEEPRPEGADSMALMEVDGEFTTSSFVPFLIVLVEPIHNAVILHEDKQYYPTAQEVYGADVETLVQEEDTQPLSEPIIAPIKVRKWVIEEKDMPETRFDKGYVICDISFFEP